MMTDIPTIAAGLTKAARRSIMEGRPDWCCSWNQQGHQYLTGRGLVEHRGGNCGALTALGLQVREYLKEQER
jgi:hypothetical protein